MNRNIKENESEFDREFDRIYRKAKNSVMTGSSHEVIYRAFIIALRKHLKISDRTDVNVWHVKQNKLQTKHTGLETIKGLCRDAYYNMTASGYDVL